MIIRGVSIFLSKRISTAYLVLKQRFSFLALLYESTESCCGHFDVGTGMGLGIDIGITL